MESLVDSKRLMNIRNLVKQTNSLPGDIAEVGVYKGGTASIIASLTTKTVYLFDTFSGIPFQNKEKQDTHLIGDFNDTSFLEVKNELAKYPNVSVYQGIFPDQTSQILENKQFSLVHLDVDVYESYKKCLEFFYPRMVPNGVIILDDYDAVTCLGAKNACDEFFADKPEVILLGTHPHAFVFKT